MRHEIATKPGKMLVTPSSATMTIGDENFKSEDKLASQARHAVMIKTLNETKYRFINIPGALKAYIYGETNTDGDKLGSNIDGVMDELQSEVKDKPHSDVKDKAQSCVKHKLQIEVKDKPERDVKDKPESDVKYKPQNDMKDKPQNDVKDKPQSDMKDKPQSDVKDKPQSDVKDKPQSDVKDKPQSDVKDKPQSDVKDKAQRTVLRRSQDCRLSVNKQYKWFSVTTFTNQSEHLVKVLAAQNKVCNEVCNPGIALLCFVLRIDGCPNGCPTSDNRICSLG